MEYISSLKGLNQLGCNPLGKDHLGNRGGGGLKSKAGLGNLDLTSKSKKEKGRARDTVHRVVT